MVNLVWAYNYSSGQSLLLYIFVGVKWSYCTLLLYLKSNRVLKTFGGQFPSCPPMVAGIFLSISGFFYGVLETRFRSLELKIVSQESAKSGPNKVHTKYLTFSLKTPWVYKA